MYTTIKLFWDYIQSLLDIDGDLYMGLFTSFILYKLAHSSLTNQDVTAYSFAITAFAYSNKQEPK